jgi:hypothetical protein
MREGISIEVSATAREELVVVADRNSAQKHEVASADHSGHGGSCGTAEITGGAPPRSAAAPSPAKYR